MLAAVMVTNEKSLTWTEGHVGAARALDACGVHDGAPCLTTRSALAHRGLLGKCPALRAAFAPSSQQQQASHHCTTPADCVSFLCFVLLSGIGGVGGIWVARSFHSPTKQVATAPMHCICRLGLRLAHYLAP